MTRFLYFFTFFFVLLFSACTNKVAAPSKPALYWYKDIVKNIAAFKTDQADDSYLTLRLEHPQSPLLKEATLILAKGHLNNAEDELAIFYYDEYLKRYSTDKVDRDFVKFLKLIAYYRSLKFADRNQKDLIDFRTQIQTHLNNPNSRYYPLMKSMYAHLDFSIQMQDHKTALFYEKRNKPKAKKLYESRSVLVRTNPKFDRPEKSWLRLIFE